MHGEIREMEHGNKPGENRGTIHNFIVYICHVSGADNIAYTTKICFALLCVCLSSRWIGTLHFHILSVVCDLNIQKHFHLRERSFLEGIIIM